MSNSEILDLTLKKLNNLTFSLETLLKWSKEDLKGFKMNIFNHPVTALITEL